MAIARGSVIGFFLGVFAGGVCTMASIAAVLSEARSLYGGLTVIPDLLLPYTI